MKIGIFSECYEPILNGVVVSINTFKKELEKRGHQYYIFTTASLDKVNDNPQVIRYPIMLPFKPKGGRYPVAWPVSARRAAKKLKELKIDLIHSQHIFGIGKTGQAAAKLAKLPAVLTYHTLLVEYAHYAPIFKGATRWYLKNASKNICNKFDQVITPSKPMADVLKEYGVTKPITAIPTGVDIQEFSHPFTRQELNTRWKVPTEKKLLLYVSRIAKEKNIDFLLKSIKMLAQKRNDFHLLMVGGGPELGNYKKMVKDLGLADLVTFTDMAPKNETVRYFGSADIFTFPSYTETQGIVVTEAMAAGVPAVAINRMGPSEIIKDSVDGYLTELNLEEFTGKISGLLDDPELRKKMSQAAINNAQEFSVKACADMMESIYAKACNNRS